MSFLTEGELDEETRRGIHEIRERKKQRDDERRKKKRDNERLSAHHEVVIDDGKQEHDEEGLNIHQEGVIGHGELDGKKKHEEKEQQRTGRWPPALQLNDAGQSSGDGADSPGPDRPKVEHAVKQSLMGPQLDDFLRPDIEKYNTDDLIPMPRGVRRTLLGPKRYTLCELRDRCTHHPGHMLQVFDIVVKCLMHDGIAGPYMLVTSGNTTGPFIDVYGTVAVRDCLDNHQSYIFQRDRTNAQKIHTTGNFLSLMNPARGILARDCSIAFNIMIKAEKAHEDVTIVGGRVKAIWEYDICRMDRISSKNGEVIFLSSIWREGVEATIELDFIEVPTGGFHMQMRGRNCWNDLSPISPTANRALAPRLAPCAAALGPWPAGLLPLACGPSPRARPPVRPRFAHELAQPVAAARLHFFLRPQRSVFCAPVPIHLFRVLLREWGDILS